MGHIAYLATRRLRVAVVVSDAIETVDVTDSMVDVPESMLVILCIVPADSQYGGPEETSRWASILATRIPRLLIIPYTELQQGYWSRAHQLASAREPPQ